MWWCRTEGTCYKRRFWGDATHIVHLPKCYEKTKDRVSNTSGDHTALRQAAAEPEQAGRRHTLGSPHIPLPQALLLQQPCHSEHFSSLCLTNSPPILVCHEFAERRGDELSGGMGLGVDTQQFLAGKSTISRHRDHHW